MDLPAILVIKLFYANSSLVLAELRVAIGPEHKGAQFVGVCKLLLQV